LSVDFVVDFTFSVSLLHVLLAILILLFDQPIWSYSPFHSKASALCMERGQFVLMWWISVNLDEHCFYFDSV